MTLVVWWSSADRPGSRRESVRLRAGPTPTIARRAIDGPPAGNSPAKRTATSGKRANAIGDILPGRWAGFRAGTSSCSQATSPSRSEAGATDDNQPRPAGAEDTHKWQSRAAWLGGELATGRQHIVGGKDVVSVRPCFGRFAVAWGAGSGIGSRPELLIGAVCLVGIRGDRQPRRRARPSHRRGWHPGR